MLILQPESELVPVALFGKSKITNNDPKRDKGKQDRKHKKTTKTKIENYKENTIR